MRLLEKLQKLPERKRKIILWSVIIVIGFGLFMWWIKIVQKSLKSFPKEGFKKQLQLPSLEEKLKKIPEIEMPKIEMPEISEEEFKKLEEELKKHEE